MTLPWAALKHHLDLIAKVGGDSQEYQKMAAESGAFYIDDARKIQPGRPAGLGGARGNQGGWVLTGSNTNGG